MTLMWTSSAGMITELQPIWVPTMSEGKEANDRNKYLADDSHNPESILIEKEM